MSDFCIDVFKQYPDHIILYHRKFEGKSCIAVQIDTKNKLHIENWIPDHDHPGELK